MVIVAAAVAAAGAAVPSMLMPAMLTLSCKREGLAANPRLTDSGRKGQSGGKGGGREKAIDYRYAGARTAITRKFARVVRGCVHASDRPKQGKA